MDAQTHETGLLISHAFLLLDGSGSMRTPELNTGQPKHRAVAAMVQDLIHVLKEDEEIQDVLLTVMCYDGGSVDDIRISAYDIKQSDEYHLSPPYAEGDLNRWDPITGHGGLTPIGRALGQGRRMAEDWVMSAPRGWIHRAVICLLSDGMNEPASEPDGISEKQEIERFNEAQQQTGEYKGRIRVASVGYFQHPEGRDVQEDAGRALLRRLAMPQRAYFDSSTAAAIAKFLHRTILAESS